MTECGRVASVNGENAKVVFKRRAECDKCRMCVASKDGKHSEITVANTLNLCEGDCVTVEVYKRKIQVLTVVLYIFAFALTALGAGVGSIMSKGASAILGVAGFVIGMAFAVPIDVCVLRKKQKPKMIRERAESEYIVNSK